MQSCDRLNADCPESLRFIGFGIRHLRLGMEQIIPNIYQEGEHDSLVFNHDPVKVSIDGAVTHFAANTLAVWDRSHRVIYGEPGRRWRLSWLQLCGREVDELLRTHEIPLNRPVHFDSERIINNYWKPLLEEFGEYIRLDLPLVRNHINGIFLEIRRALREDGCGEIRIPEIFRQIRNELDDTYTQEVTLTGLAARAHLAPAYFSRKFKEYFGLSPIDYVIALRLHDAALQLRNPELAIQEVAELAGYRDGFHFSRLFKRHFGVSPRTFRRNFQLLQQNLWGAATTEPEGQS